MEKKYFGTDGIRGRVGKGFLNPEFVLKLGWAVGKVLGKKEGAKILIGKDTRISSYLIEACLEAGLSSAGMNVNLLGPMPTPAVAHLTKSLRADVGVMVSASHNPYYDNGIKFFSKDGFKLSDSVELDIEKLLLNDLVMANSDLLGKVKRVDYAEGRYIEYCKRSFPRDSDLSGLKIVIDCANGATYKIAPMIFQELGADVISINVNPNGFNINKDCGSTSPKSLVRTVLDCQADLGMALDGDGDRLILVDHKGNIVDGDQILYILAKYHNDIRTNDFKGIVGTVMSNMGLEIALKNLNIPFKRTKVGDRYVIEELIKQGWTLGGEASGHIIDLANSTTGDGIIACLQVLTSMVKNQISLIELTQSMIKYPHKIVNLALKDMSVDLNSEEIQSRVRKAEEQLGEFGRVVLRKSGTEPKVRIMVEANDEQLMENCLNFLVKEVESIL
tara:strand:- start:18359 stop:19696 length:1338 start_codon:yes stop_codon:yes gene_type:complete